MVVPESLVKPAIAIKALTDNGSPWLEQATLAQFIRDGSLINHLKRVRNIYQLRRDVVIASMKKYFGEASVLGEQAGTHMLWRLPDKFPPAQDLRQIARLAGVGLYPLQSETVVYPDRLPSFERQVLLGYVHLKPIQIDQGFGRIAAALKKFG